MSGVNFHVYQSAKIRIKILLSFFPFFNINTCKPLSLRHVVMLYKKSVKWVISR